MLGAELAEAIGGELAGLGGTGASGNLDPEQRGERAAQSERPTDKAAGPVRAQDKEKEEPQGLTSQFDTPLFDQILDNILQGRSPLETITFEKFESQLSAGTADPSTAIHN